ncbi:MAG TPA: hypothetical protein VGP28_06150 [Methylocella sp.]|jgi:hypothetical protein|nr:hypothetical protein [Methylocella sp.]
MSEQNNNEARVRAAELRKQIDELLRSGKSDGHAGDHASSPDKIKPKSPREFIHERMRALNQKRDPSD